MSSGTAAGLATPRPQCPPRRLSSHRGPEGPSGGRRRRPGSPRGSAEGLPEDRRAGAGRPRDVTLDEGSQWKRPAGSPSNVPVITLSARPPTAAARQPHSHRLLFLPLTEASLASHLPPARQWVTSPVPASSSYRGVLAAGRRPEGRPPPPLQCVFTVPTTF